MSPKLLSFCITKASLSDGLEKQPGCPSLQPTSLCAHAGLNVLAPRWTRCAVHVGTVRAKLQGASKHSSWWRSRCGRGCVARWLLFCVGLGAGAGGVGSNNAHVLVLAATNLPGEFVVSLSSGGLNGLASDTPFISISPGCALAWLRLKAPRALRIPFDCKGGTALAESCALKVEA
eukprot:1160300-Pelagomonas_calceolata.AAC.10